MKQLHSSLHPPFLCLRIESAYGNSQSGKSERVAGHSRPDQCRRPCHKRERGCLLSSMRTWRNRKLTTVTRIIFPLKRLVTSAAAGAQAQDKGAASRRHDACSRPSCMPLAPTTPLLLLSQQPHSLFHSRISLSRPVNIARRGSRLSRD